MRRKKDGPYTYLGTVYSVCFQEGRRLRGRMIQARWCAGQDTIDRPDKGRHRRQSPEAMDLLTPAGQLGKGVERLAQHSRLPPPQSGKCSSQGCLEMLASHMVV